MHSAKVLLSWPFLPGVLLVVALCVVLARRFADALFAPCERRVRRERGRTFKDKFP